MTTNNQTVLDRQKKQKEDLLATLQQQPIIEIACKKVGIGRSTYYRWLKEDDVFKAATEDALQTGRDFINDMAESQLLTAIRDHNLTAIMFWLKNNHLKYAARIAVTAEMKQVNQELTPEQQQIVEEALRLAALTEDNSPITQS